MLRATERVLSARHDVTCAAHPNEALELLRSTRPDLAVCDIRMPTMDGFALADLLRGEQPDLDVIFMTGSHTAPAAHLVRAMKERAFYFIQKPFDREVIEVLVERCLELRRLRHAERRHVDRLEHELGEARAFQQTMLAPEQREVEGVSIAATCRACSELGGRSLRLRAGGKGTRGVCHRGCARARGRRRRS